MAAGILTLLCLGGLGVAFLRYDEETKIDRSRPDTVTDSFLIAYLVNRNDKEAQLFSCSSPELANLSVLRDQIIKREKDFKVNVSVSWGPLSRDAVDEDHEKVTTQLTISGSSAGKLTSSRNEDWQFLTVNEDGWRVCGAEKIS